MNEPAQKPKQPSWLKWSNKVVTFALRRGLSIGTMYVLTTTGRKTGNLVSSPVSLLTTNGADYICAIGDTDWVQNVRKNPTASLRRGRETQQVRLVEVPLEQRGQILRQFPAQIPGGVPYFKSSLKISGTPSSFESAADRCRVFKIEHAKA